MVRRAARILVLIVLLSACVASGAPATVAPTPRTFASATPTPTAAPATPLPPFGHVWIIVLENKGYDRVVGAADAPYFNRLIDRYGLATSYHGVARPSQPNYFALFSGSTHGVTDNKVHDLDAPTIADQIEASGRTWRQHSENVPLGCYTESKSTGGRDGPGDYRRKHSPAISFKSIRDDPRRCAYIQDLTAFQPGDADFVLVIPNECHNSHDCEFAKADAWLAGFVPRITDSAAFRDNGVLFVTFDEGAPGDPNGGHVATIVISPTVEAGQKSDLPHDHYSLLSTIQWAWGLGCLENSCTANTLGEFFPVP